MARDFISPASDESIVIRTLAILRRRYASGELTREQYDQMRQVLHDEAP